MTDNTNETAKCPHCFGSIDPRATICRHCRKRIGSMARWRSGRLIIAFGVLVILGGLLVEPLLFIAVGAIFILIGAAVRGPA